MSVPSDGTPPKHIAIIMDGNRRWAQAHGLQPWRGHAKGQEVLRRIARSAFEQGISYLSVYAFSTENWQRNEREVSYLMRHVGLAIRKYLHEFSEAGVKVVFLGTRTGLAPSVLKAIDQAEAKTAHNVAATLGVCFNYGSLQELVDATSAIIANGAPKEPVTTEMLMKHLYVPEIPPVDLLIRSGGERRLSNFMLARAAYAELYFTDILWPDFGEDDLKAALSEYASRQRRFGN